MTGYRLQVAICGSRFASGAPAISRLGCGRDKGPEILKRKQELFFVQTLFQEGYNLIQCYVEA